MCLGEEAEKAEAEVLVELADKVGLEKPVFEAESNAHRVWGFKKFGAEVDLGPNRDFPSSASSKPPGARSAARAATPPSSIG